MPTFHLPTIPYGPIDSLNRRAAAVGSPGYAQAASGANYNGHHWSLRWNSYRGYYITETFWAGRVVIARGAFEPCFRALLEEYGAGALGTSATIEPRDDDAAAVSLLSNHELVKLGREETLEWYTWRHQAAAECARDYALPQAGALLFDWELMQAATDRQDYEARLREKYGHAYR